MDIKIDEGLRAYIDPLTEDEYAALARSLLAEGCRDALVLWGDLLIDGHNRYAICRKHDIAFHTVQNTSFKSMDDVHLWMIDNHLGRRSVSDFQRGVLALRKKEIMDTRVAAPVAAVPEAPEQGSATNESTASGSPPWDEGTSTPASHAHVTEPLTRQALARAARLSSNTLGQIEKIRKDAAPELVRAVKDGTISINAAAAVSSLPVQEQTAAVAGGKKELQQAARQVRQAKAPAKPAPEPEIPIDDIDDYPAEVARLRHLLLELTDERDQLKKKVMHLTVALAEARRTDE